MKKRSTGIKATVNIKRNIPLKIGPFYPIAGYIKAKFPEADYVCDSLQAHDIQVTTAHIKAAVPGDHRKCAMAIACREKTHADEAYIGISRSYLRYGDVVVRFNTVESVSREIVSFDRMKNVRGFIQGTYGLAAIGQKERLRTPQGKRRQHNGTAGPRPTAHRHFTEGIRSPF